MIKQILIVLMWIAVGLAASMATLLIPSQLGLVGPGWNRVVEAAAQPVTLVFMVAGVLFVGGRPRAAFVVAGVAITVVTALVVFTVVTASTRADSVAPL